MSHGGAIRLEVDGMHCAACTAGVERALRAVPLVRDASVSLVDSSATVSGDGVDPDSLLQAVRAAGYGASLSSGVGTDEMSAEAMDRRQQRTASRWKRRALVAGAAWLPLEAWHWLAMLAGNHADHAGVSAHDLASLILAAIVMAIVGSAFIRSALRAAARGATNMDTLIALGSTASFLFSTVAFALRAADRPPVLPLYFTENVGLLALISLGHYLEARTTAAAGRSIRDLLSLQPERVRRLADSLDPTGESVPTRAVAPGDLLLFTPGERVAVDSIIVPGGGRSTLDESIVTGESMPVERGPGDRLVSGSINLTGRLVARADTSGRDTTIQRIADLVRRAQASKADIQRIADRVSSVFVPSVLIVAAVTFAAWAMFGPEGSDRWVHAAVNATTVLIISCPCALGLATPTAVMAATGAASRRGILIRSARALERVGRARTLLLDKTGTLTRGRPRVVHAEDRTLALAASLASGSAHPLAAAILREVESRRLSDRPLASDVREVAGIGLSGVAIPGGQRLELLSPSAAFDRGLDLAEPADQDLQGATRSMLVQDGQPVGFIHFLDTPRENSRAFIEEAHRRGLSTIMLTGDREGAAHAVARALGMNEPDVRAGLSPVQKVDAVETESRSGPVIMVGDGINDAAALARAGAAGGAGVAVGTGGGTGIAMESADAVLPSPNLFLVLDLIDIGRRTLTTIRQNLFLSFAYNSLAIPAAAFGLLGMRGPLIAAAAMALSDLCVVGNSLRLKHRLERGLPPVRAANPD